MKGYGWMIGVLMNLFVGLSAQNVSEKLFIPPFDFPLTLSGNFGELRANHFHGGLDFKTQGVVGKPVRNIADGYVSRVTVTPGGYGQAVYMVHDNGYTSVHGHLLRFAPAIAKVVEEYQYENETFAVDLEFEPDRFRFAQGEVFAWSGNEGYSFGPHLHMEIRKTETGEYIDPLQFYMDKIKDTTAPRATHIMIYPQRGKGVLNGKQAKQLFALANLKKPLEAWGEIAIGIKAYDYMDGTHNNYGVRTVKLYVDSVEVFRSTVDGFLPDENRMINAWTDYEEYVTKSSWFMRSQILPGNRWRMLEADEKGGVVTVDEERDYQFCYELEDLYGNSRKYSFVVKGKRQPIDSWKPEGKNFLRWDRKNVVWDLGMELIIPEGMLYEDVELNYSLRKDSASVSYEYQIHDTPVPLHEGCMLKIGIHEFPITDMSKYYVIQKKKGRKVSMGGYFENGFMHAAIRELGTYTVDMDTVPPKVVPLDKGRWHTGNVQFKITDAETGIKSYKVYIDGKFALFAFSSKNARLRLKHPERLKKGVLHEMEVVITDYCGNETREWYEF